MIVCVEDVPVKFSSRYLSGNRVVYKQFQNIGFSNRKLYLIICAYSFICEACAGSVTDDATEGNNEEDIDGSTCTSEGSDRDADNIIMAALDDTDEVDRVLLTWFKNVPSYIVVHLLEGLRAVSCRGPIKVGTAFSGDDVTP